MCIVFSDPKMLHIPFGVFLPTSTIHHLPLWPAHAPSSLSSRDQHKWICSKHIHSHPFMDTSIEGVIFNTKLIIQTHPPMTSHPHPSPPYPQPTQILFCMCITKFCDHGIFKLVMIKYIGLYGLIHQHDWTEMRRKV